MSQFVGKWKGNKASRKNFDEYCKMTGAPEDLVDKYRNATTTIEYKKEDENWTMTVLSDAIPKPRVYKYKLGEECVSKDAQGKGIKHWNPRFNAKTHGIFLTDVNNTWIFLNGANDNIKSLTNANNIGISLTNVDNIGIFLTNDNNTLIYLTYAYTIWIILTNADNTGKSLTNTDNTGNSVTNADNTGHSLTNANNT
ncbi:unnamed protein product [Mytilus coruscus]|uniref:Uncharacterized protein n=1 Tax=Mytilus coruscus TaxID=42192 RepID=A0A6J8C370_MYTCO|nr:unnamed protein product [Mytilus coruscus]